MDVYDVDEIRKSDEVAKIDVIWNINQVVITLPPILRNYNVIIYLIYG